MEYKPKQRTQQRNLKWSSEKCKSKQFHITPERMAKIKNTDDNLCWRGCIAGGSASWYSHQQCRSVPFSPQPLQHKLSSVFLILAILTGVRWNLRVVLICISLMTKDVEHFLKCLSAILDSSVESSLFRSVLHFFY